MAPIDEAGVINVTGRASGEFAPVFRVNHPELSYNHSGQYGETFRFNYSGEG